MNRLYKYTCLVIISMLWIQCTTNQSNVKKEKPKIIIQEVKDTDELDKLKAFKRIITIGDEVTEVVMALGDSSKIVAIGRTLEFSPNFKRPKVGYKGSLQSKFMLKHKPDLVLSDIEGNKDSVAINLKEKGVEYFLLKNEFNVNSLKNLITKIARILKRKKQAEQINAQIDQQLDSIRIIRKKRKDSLRVLYVHARGPEILLAAGINTPVDALIQLAGAKNAASLYEIEGMARLTVEDMQAINPDFILMSKKGLASVAGRLYEVPVIFSSTAYKLGRIIIYDDYFLLNFGLNSPKVALDLCKKLYKGQYYAPLPNTIFPTDPLVQQPEKEYIKEENLQKPKQDVGLEDLKGGGIE